MSRLIAFNSVSLDGHVAGSNGDLSWPSPARTQTRKPTPSGTPSSPRTLAAMARSSSAASPTT